MQTARPVLPQRRKMRRASVTFVAVKTVLRELVEIVAQWEIYKIFLISRTFDPMPQYVYMFGMKNRLKDQTVALLV